MRFAIHVPNFGDFQDLRATATLARDAEAAGWDGFFLWDHLQYGKRTSHPTVDPWVCLAAIATQTQRIRLGPWSRRSRAGVPGSSRVRRSRSITCRVVA